LATGSQFQGEGAKPSDSGHTYASSGVTDDRGAFEYVVCVQEDQIERAYRRVRDMKPVTATRGSERNPSPLL
jgi:hypothetical protein